MNHTILIIEDDASIAQLLKRALEKWQWNIILTENFTHIDQVVLKHQPDLILLDINLPEYDGFYWCQKIREFSSVPIIFISSRDTNMDKIMAMNLGGDDFINKPFSIDLLVAKINALLRRTYAYTSSHQDTLTHQNVVLNTKNSTVSFFHNTVELSKTEYQLLYQLITHAGEIVKRDTLLDTLWDNSQFVDDSTLTVNINRLRKKLNSIEVPTDFIKTKIGQGYIIE